MENHPTISGTETIRRARNLKYVPGASFTLIHLTCNFKTKDFGQAVKCERCRVRPALREDTFQLDGDLYFTYEDLDTGEPKMCFKRLMRYIGFPPHIDRLANRYLSGDASETDATAWADSNEKKALDELPVNLSDFNRWVGVSLSGGEYFMLCAGWIIREALKKDSLQREIIHLNLLKLSEELNFAFIVEENRIVPNHLFKKNPVAFVKIGRNRYWGKRFEIDLIARTDITAREFSDCFDIFASMQGELTEEDQHDCINQICAILFPKYADYNTNLISGHQLQMRRVNPSLKFGIILWFTGIVKFYQKHPVYGLLFKSENHPEDSGNKIHLGMNEIAITLQKEGYGMSETMKLNDYFDAQVKYLKDMINRALAEGVKPEKLSEKSGIPLSTIQKLS
jgi:hypothetical protein